MLQSLEKDSHKALGMIDVEEDLKHLSHESTEPLVIEHLNTLQDSFHRIIHLCESTLDADFSNNDALSLMVFYQNAEGSASYLSSYQPQNHTLVGLVSNVSKWFKTSMLPFIKNVGSKLLAILASMATPKEWSIKGNTGTLGLSNVELQIKFSQ